MVRSMELNLNKWSGGFDWIIKINLNSFTSNFSLKHVFLEPKIGLIFNRFFQFTPVYINDAHRRKAQKLKCEPPTTKSECLQVVKPIRACSTLLICSCFGDCERETGDGEQRRKLKIGNSSNAKHCTIFLSQSHHKVCIEFKCCELTAILTVSSEYFKLIWVKKGRENFRAENCSGRAGEKFCRTIVKCNRIFLYESAFNSLQSWFTI